MAYLSVAGMQCKRIKSIVRKKQLNSIVESRFGLLLFSTMPLDQTKNKFA